MHENRLSEEELRGLSEGKMESIRSFVSFLKRSLTCILSANA
jgi:hypothetical protein